MKEDENKESKSSGINTGGLGRSQESNFNKPGQVNTDINPAQLQPGVIGIEEDETDQNSDENSKSNDQAKIK